MSELRTGFHQQLKHIEAGVIQLYAFITEDLALATQALLGDDATALKVVSEREAVIDALYREVERVVDEQLTLQAPVASELRLVVSSMRIVPELERSHDLVAHLAEHATHRLAADLSPRARGLVQTMGDTAGEMWDKAAHAWYERDANAVYDLAASDEGMDGLHAALMAELASGKMSLPVAMDMTLVARYYERLGDHSVNVTRRVVYLARGTQQP